MIVNDERIVIILCLVGQFDSGYQDPFFIGIIADGQFLNNLFPYTGHHFNLKLDKRFYHCLIGFDHTFEVENPDVLLILAHKHKSSSQINNWVHKIDSNTESVLVLIFFFVVDGFTRRLTDKIIQKFDITSLWAHRDRKFERIREGVLHFLKIFFLF